MDEQENKYVVSVFMEHGIRIQFLADLKMIEGLLISFRKPHGKRGVWKMEVPEDVKGRITCLDMDRVISIETVDVRFAQAPAPDENAGGN